MAGRCGGPEGKFLHEGGFFGCDERFESLVEGGEVRMVGDGVEGGVVAAVALVFPDVDFGGQQRLVGGLV